MLGKHREMTKLWFDSSLGVFFKAFNFRQRSSRRGKQSFIHNTHTREKDENFARDKKGRSCRVHSRGGCIFSWEQVEILALSPLLLRKLGQILPRKLPFRSQRTSSDSPLGWTSLCCSLGWPPPVSRGPFRTKPSSPPRTGKSPLLKIRNKSWGIHVTKN